MVHAAPTLRDVPAALPDPSGPTGRALVLCDQLARRLDLVTETDVANAWNAAPAGGPRCRALAALLDAYRYARFVGTPDQVAVRGGYTLPQFERRVRAVARQIARAQRAS